MVLVIEMMVTGLKLPRTKVEIFCCFSAVNTNKDGKSLSLMFACTSLKLPRNWQEIETYQIQNSHTALPTVNTYIRSETEFRSPISAQMHGTL